MGDRGRQAAGDVVGDMPPADRNRVGEDQSAVEEHADRRGPTAHIDDGHAEIDFVVDEARQAGGIGTDDEGVDGEMGAADRRAVIAHAGGARSDHVHVDAQPLAEHAAWVANAAAVVDRKADWNRMDDLAVAGFAQ